MGDREAEFAGFFEAEYRPLRRFGFLLAGNWSEAEDLAQEALARTFEAWKRIRHRDKPASYARSVVVNLHCSRLRRALARASRRNPPMGAVGGPNAEERIDLWEAIRGLPSRQRAALVLRFYEDLPEAEIAAILDAPLGTVKSLLHRGLVRMRSRLSEEPAAVPDGSEQG